MRWPSVGLGEICKPKQWKNISTKDFTTSGYSVYGANGKIGFFHEFTHEEPVILVACRGATCGAINVTEPYSYANSNAMALDSIDTTKIDLRYLAKYLGYRGFQDVVSGSAQPQITSENIAKVEVLLPPLGEQRRIAAILDKIDELSGADRRRQDLLKAFPLSVYRQMFGDPRHNPFQWPVFRLGEICLNEDARRVPVKSSDRKAMQGRYPYYGASGVIDHVDDYLFDGRRLLVGEDGANLIARSSPVAFIADGKYWVNNHAHVLGENGKAKLRFLEYYFALVDLKPFVTGSAQPKLTRSALDSLPVPLPPLALQKRFESVLAALDARFAQAQISARKTLSLGSALRYASFQGDAG